MKNFRSVMLASAILGASIAYAPPKDAGSKASADQTPTLADGVAGHDLLAEVAASPTGEVLMTEGQAAEGIAAGYLVADVTRAADGRAPVKLTDAGFAKFQEGEAASAVSAPANYEIDTDVAMPTSLSRRGGGRRGSSYPFDALQVGQSFHVPATAKMPKPAESLASTVTGARAKYAEPTGNQKEHTVVEYQKGADGKGFAKDAEGKRIKIGETKEMRPETRITRDFRIVAVDASDPRGPGARVFRTA